MKQHCLFHFLHFDLMNQNMLIDILVLKTKYLRNLLSSEFATIQNNNHWKMSKFHLVERLSNLEIYLHKYFHQNLYYHSKHTLLHLLLDLPKHYL